MSHYGSAREYDEIHGSESKVFADPKEIIDRIADASCKLAMILLKGVKIL